MENETNQKTFSVSFSGLFLKSHFQGSLGVRTNWPNSLMPSGKSNDKFIITPCVNLNATAAQCRLV